MILALLTAAYAPGWLHLRLDIVVEGALHPIVMASGRSIVQSWLRPAFHGRGPVRKKAARRDAMAVDAIPPARFPGTFQERRRANDAPLRRTDRGSRPERL